MCFNSAAWISSNLENIEIVENFTDNLYIS